MNTLKDFQPDQTLLEVRVQPFIKDSTAKTGVHTKISNRQALVARCGLQIVTRFSS